jgi:hypothetical protein
LVAVVVGIVEHLRAPSRVVASRRPPRVAAYRRSLEAASNVAPWREIKSKSRKPERQADSPPRPTASPEDLTVVLKQQDRRDARQRMAGPRARGMSSAYALLFSHLYLPMCWGDRQGGVGI